MSELAVEVKPKGKITSEEMQRRRDTLRQAKAHSRIEGQYPTPQAEAIFEAFVHGDKAITLPAAFGNLSAGRAQRAFRYAAPESD